MNEHANIFIRISQLPLLLQTVSKRLLLQSAGSRAEEITKPIHLALLL